MGRESDLRRVLFESSGARRFTQDSPVLPDVWIAYDAPGDPLEGEQDLLITPHFGGLAGRLGKNLRDALLASRGKMGREPPRIAQLPGIVAVRLYLDELLRIVVPRTDWWQQEIAGQDAADIERGFHRMLSQIGQRDAAPPEQEPEPPPPDDDPRSLSTGHAWLLHVVAFLIAGEKGPSRDDYVRAYQEVFGDEKGFPDILARCEPVVGVAAVNRRAEPATMESVLAVKADAARLLFNVSCANITWAVIDSGIDGRHPAFAARDPATGAPIMVKGEDGTDRVKSRVVGTYDLTLVRELLDPLYISSLFKEGAELDPRQQAIKRRYEANLYGRDLREKDEAPRLARQLCHRLEAGFELDWGLIEPFLWEPEPRDPVSGHGTMVAGILGADWRNDPGIPAPVGDANPGAQAQSAASARPWVIHMQGICPDIRLYDMRVIGDKRESREFEVLAALQLIRHLNEQSDRREIHGANLSLSTEHDVTSYACGSTLVCQECDRTWASGVVLVAAAGNRGHQHYLISSGKEPGGKELGGYHAMSITDPGNAEGVITVGATHRANPHQYGVSYFSSRGPTGDGRRKPDLVAPGEKVAGPVPHKGQTTDDGTSFAAPHVSGAAAMLMARHAELIGRPQRIKEILCSTATDLGRERYFQGAGMLDILRALQSV